MAQSANRAGKAVLAEARHKAASPLIQRLERFGYIIRGLIYIVIGLLALLLAAGAGGAATSPTSAIQLIGRQQFGTPLLVLIAVGLAGYSLWGFVRAFLDPLGRGSKTSGLIDRVAFLVSGVFYGALFYLTLLILMHKPGGSSLASGSGLPASLTSGPMGRWGQVVIGLILVIIGVAQLMIADKASFLRDLKTGGMNAQELKEMTVLGKIGYAARGIVVALVGILILQTIFGFGVSHPQGFDGALATLAHGPYGSYVLGAVSIGLILFGIFSAMCAKWIRIGSRRPG